MAAHRSQCAEPASAAATALLYQRHGRHVLRFCRRFLRNRQDAEDALQTTFLRAQGALERGTVPENEEAWLVAIARNVCLRQVDSARRRGTLERTCEPLDLEAAPAPEVPDELVDIDRALASMPETQRRAILLREWKGLAYREVAADLGITQAAVEALLFRARRTLATALGDTHVAVRRRAGGLAAVPFVGSLKSAIGGLSAAKIAAGAAATVAAAVVVAPPFRAAIAEPSPAQDPRPSLGISRAEAAVRGEGLAWQTIREPAQVPARPVDGRGGPSVPESTTGRDGSSAATQGDAEGSASPPVGLTLPEPVTEPQPAGPILAPAALPDLTLPETPPVDVTLP